jgi:dTDP-4-dehydrorhamnose 3,5-epimerase
VLFRETAVAGAFLVEPERIEDDRGYFARTFSAGEFADHGLDPRVSQCSTSFNARAGTLRGMHFQRAPHGEAKLVRCVRGAVFDVALDLRPDSASHLRWFGAELSAANGHALYVPEGCAHGFQTLEDASEILYQMNKPFVPGAGDGVRWDDPAFGIEWPAPPPGGRIMARRDAEYPDFAP